MTDSDRDDGVGSRDNIPPPPPSSSKRLPSPLATSALDNAAATAAAAATKSSSSSLHQRSLNVSNSPSTASPSPFSSRDSSPSRSANAKPSPHASQPLLPQMSAPLPKRSRQHSKDVSPSRPPALPGVSNTVPSAAAIQRALSSTTAPQLQPTTVADLKAPRPLRPSASGSASASASPGPASPRIKSPPPSATRSRKNSITSSASRSLTPQPPPPSSSSQAAKSSLVASNSTPNIVVQSSTPPPATSGAGTGTGTATPSSSSSTTPRPGNKHDVNNSDSEDQAPLTMKFMGRVPSPNAPTLETVEEGSVPPTPGNELSESQTMTQSSFTSKSSDNEPSDSSTAKVSEDLSQKSKATESGSDSGGNKSDGKRSLHHQRSLSRNDSIPLRPPGKSKADVGSKNMTVETETIPSIPQATITQAERISQPWSEASGSLRMKPSSETIRPKKERRRQVRKPASINSGTASTKADIFEIKVANAVDEANSSDSDETFVYESNPPDTQARPGGRHHSRTPSATSMASNGEPPRNLRSIGAILENHRSVPSKRSMKFANNPYTSSPTQEAPEHGDGTVRLGNGRTSGGSSIHHHHIGRYGRNGNNHPSLFDSDSPFPQSKGRAASSRQSSRPNSPRFSNAPSRLGNGVSKEHGTMSVYDMEGEGADDERTPLIGTVRGPRTRTPRRPNSANIRHFEHFHHHNQGNWVRRFAGCMVMTIMLLLLVCGAVGFLFATTKPLYGVGVRQIQNVLASEQEIMLDLLVEAINPNVIAVTVSDMDVNVFAKSKHVGTDKWWREHGDVDPAPAPWRSPRLQQRTKKTVSGYESFTTENTVALRPTGNKDEGTDPIDDEDPSSDSQTMLLGRIYHFDSALVFEGSAMQRHPHFSVGEVRLSKPGNKTEAGGTERWERVMKYPFELIVRGVLRYELPLSSTVHTAPIGASVVVRPSKGVDDGEQTPGSDPDDDDDDDDGDNNNSPEDDESDGELSRNRGHWWWWW